MQVHKFKTESSPKRISENVQIFNPTREEKSQSIFFRFFTDLGLDKKLDSFCYKVENGLISLIRPLEDKLPIQNY